ncbi:Similar to Phospholipase A2 (Apis dorsata), partial [Cotesia congregata]
MIFIFWNLILINSAAASIKDTSKNLTIINEFKYKVDKFNNSVNYINRKRRLLVPGSLWCGVGNVAIQEDDVGQFHKTDTCCRNRDLCGFKHKEVLLHFESQKDMASKFFGKPVCKCESEFYFCLRRANTFLSRNLGRLYFSIIRPKCYTYDHPSVYCIRFQGSHTSRNNENKERRFIFNFGQYLLSEIGSIVKAPFNFIVPGTKWCGKGNIAEDQSDLGVFKFIKEDVSSMNLISHHQKYSSGETVDYFQFYRIKIIK